MNLRSSQKNPIAKALRSPHLQPRTIADKRKATDRQKIRSSLKSGKYDHHGTICPFYSVHELFAN